MTSDELTNQRVMFKSFDMLKYRAVPPGIEGFPNAPGLRVSSASGGLVFSSDLPPGDIYPPVLWRTCPLRVLPQAGAAASPGDKSGKDGALSTVA